MGLLGFEGVYWGGGLKGGGGISVVCMYVSDLPA